MTETEKYWETTPLENLTDSQWEALCDGCGLCCLVRLADEDTGEVYDTFLACAELDIDMCRCRAYGTRFDRNPDCRKMTVSMAGDADWLPDTCAYRRLAQGRSLPSWHPLLTGDPESVHAAGMSVRDFAVSCHGVPEEAYVDYVIGGDPEADDFGEPSA